MHQPQTAELWKHTYITKKDTYTNYYLIYDAQDVHAEAFSYRDQETKSIIVEDHTNKIMQSLWEKVG